MAVTPRPLNMRRGLTVAWLVAWACLSRACLWDYDTFAVEAAGDNDLVAVLVGRFERNPPPYYKMRLEHSLKAIEQQPSNLELYDNAAVAAERLGKSERALEIIERKKVHLRPLPQDKEHWYRFFANRGTFYAHLAMKSPERRTSLLGKAEADVQKAILINPNAHFGRERYQLVAIRWLLHGVPKKQGFWEYMGTHGEQAIHGRDPVLGLSGLIRLGAAWENIDIWMAISAALAQRQDSSLAQFAIERIKELEASRKKGLTPLQHGSTYADEAEYLGKFAPEDSIKGDNTDLYRKLRDRAEAWHENRTAYMTERLKLGRHPDWDTKFWAEWKDEPKLDVPSPGPWERIPYQTRVAYMIGGAVLVILATPVLLWWWVRRRKLRAA